MKIYLDDIRNGPDGWKTVRNVFNLMDLLEQRDVTHLSLDHDMGENQRTGYDLLCWIERKVYSGEMTEVPVLTIHSANPVGRDRMKMVIESIKSILEARI